MKHGGKEEIRIAKNAKECQKSPKIEYCVLLLNFSP
jgi:hypothetical protein